MKLIRFGEYRKEKPGVLDSAGTRRDCSALFKDWNYEFFSNNGIHSLQSVDFSKLPAVPDKERWGAPVSRPGKVVCIGLNYHAHARETNSQIPREPIIFIKASNAVVGPYDNIVIPRDSVSTDWEIELGIVIGKDCRYLDSEAEAPEYIAGYMISNDVSERDFQKNRGGQWTKGKSCDTFNPVGPFMATQDEICNVNDLEMQLKVNGELMQSGNTGDMIFAPYFLVRYISRFMTLEAGDVISTGTPAGVGMGMKPPKYLKQSDVLELCIKGLGYQKQKVESYR